MSKKQLLKILDIYGSIGINKLDKRLQKLKRDDLIDNIVGHMKKGTPYYYFLTKNEHSSIGEMYTILKAPVYNLNQHLETNDYLISILTLTQNHSNLKKVLSEHRQVLRG